MEHVCTCVSILNPVARRVVHNNDDDNDAGRTGMMA